MIEKWKHIELVHSFSDPPINTLWLIDQFDDEENPIKKKLDRSYGSLDAIVYSLRERGWELVTKFDSHIRVIDRPDKPVKFFYFKKPVMEY